MVLRSVQHTLLGEAANEPRSRRGLGTFQDNLSMPVHRWFRYPAGFSGEWVEHLLRNEKQAARHLLDPFAGTGTTLVSGQLANVESIGLESHPFVSRVAEAKLLWPTDPNALLDAARRVGESAQPLEEVRPAPLLERCYAPASLQKLLGLKRSLEVANISETERKLLWLAVAAILRRCSPVGTAQWQYILPKKTKSRVQEPLRAFQDQVALMVADMRWMQRRCHPPDARILPEDARKLSSVPNDWADLVVTSPPYPNNYDYADATRLEMTFFGEIQGWGDLQSRVRPFLVRSCSQHVASTSLEPLLASPKLSAIRSELEQTYYELGAERTRHGGKKAYHSMVVGYFYDLAESWIEIRRMTRPGGSVCFVIGDSAPYGIYVPADRWLGELAMAAGFSSYSFEKLRDRNVKWLNRKHRVPLKEGLLWVEG